MVPHKCHVNGQFNPSGLYASSQVFSTLCVAGQGQIRDVVPLFLYFTTRVVVFFVWLLFC